jgi:hypothetical protein
MPPEFQNCSCKTEGKKQIHIHLVTTDEGGQKNRNGKTTAVLFYHVFYYNSVFKCTPIAVSSVIDPRS